MVSVRYFGGTKLGVGGLIQAYKTSAQWTLEASKIEEKTIDAEFLLLFEYPEMNIVMRSVKDEKIKVLSQEMEAACCFKISVRKKEAERIFKLFKNTYKVTIKKL
jgi:putative IMPACT (imprinted ancient) family translation regulator